MNSFRPRPSATTLALFIAATAVSFPAFTAPIATIKPVESRRRVVAAASSYRGIPYRLGGTDRKGLDCSGFVAVSYRDALGIEIPRTVRELHGLAEAVELADLQSGDLVFFDTTGPLSHVGIYTGKGRFLHAASEGPLTGVIVFAGAGRLIAPARFLGLLSVSR
jgi:cell wall-associated NlpC family hydrolase